MHEGAGIDSGSQSYGSSAGKSNMRIAKGPLPIAAGVCGGKAGVFGFVFNFGKQKFFARANKKNKG